MVKMEAEHVAVREGDKLQLSCKVKGGRGLLSVTWEHKPGSTVTGSFKSVASLSREGLMEPGRDFAKRSVKAAHLADHVFTLELSDVVPSDAGAYQFTVSEWTVKPNGDVDRTHSQSQTCNVTVRLLSE